MREKSVIITNSSVIWFEKPRNNIVIFMDQGKKEQCNKNKSARKIFVSPGLISEKERKKKA